MAAEAAAIKTTLLKLPGQQKFIFFAVLFYDKPILLIVSKAWNRARASSDQRAQILQFQPKAGLTF